MSNVVQEHIDIYRERINALYSNAQKWAAPLSTEVQDVQVLEQASGPYPAQCLVMKKTDGSEIARLEPVGTWILGAEGRLDLKGGNGQEVIIYLTDGGPTFNFGESEGDEETGRGAMALFRGVDRPGWYWIEDSRRGRARLVTKELFRDLVSEVSDYAFE